MAGSPFILAQQVDGFGSRLQAILNAWSVAAALNLEFRFSWPPNQCVQFSKAAEIFSDDFLRRFELPESSSPCNAADPNLRLLTISEAKLFCHGLTSVAVNIGVSLEIFRFADESHDEASERFRRGLTEIEWSSTISNLMQLDSLAGLGAIHVRAGDIVLGEWRQIWPVEKYLPSCFVSHAITHLQSTNSAVVVLSDNPEYVSHLKSKFRNLVTPIEIIPQYSELTSVQQAFADVLVLSRASSLFAPVLSNFSQLAGSIGGAKLQGVADLMDAEDALHFFRDFIEQAKNQYQPEVLRPLLARDTCWILDVFADSLALEDRISLVTRAVQYDSEFVSAQTRYALYSALAGHRDTAAEAALNAQTIASHVNLYEDAQLEAFACSICISVLNLGSHDSSSHRAHDDENLLTARSSLAICEGLKPCIINHQQLHVNLRFLVATIEWFTQADLTIRQAFIHALHPCINQRSGLGSWRREGFAVLHSSSGPYPAVLRNVEEVSVQVSLALGKILLGSRSGMQRVAVSRVEGLNCSPSGLQWATGWAYDGQNRNDLLLSCLQPDGSFSGTLTFLQRPDVEKTFGNSHALRSGFCMPIPVAPRADSGRNQWTFVVLRSGPRARSLGRRFLRAQFFTSRLAGSLQRFMRTMCRGLSSRRPP